jgi:hypothetical protein
MNSLLTADPWPDDVRVPSFGVTPLLGDRLTRRPIPRGDNRPCIARRAYNEDMDSRPERHIGDILKERSIEIIGADPVTRHGFTQVPLAARAAA